MRVDAYIRVSRMGDRSTDDPSFISEKVQLESIEAWAKMKGHEIVQVHAELDVSGGTTNRPKLNEAMRRIENGDTEGLVVWRLDRLGRTLVGTLELIERIDKRGAIFASVSDDFDISSHNGRLVLRIMLSIAQWELERIRASWAEAQSQAVQRGIHISPVPPTGYKRSIVGHSAKGRAIQGPLVEDEVTGPLVRELFRRRARGESWTSLYEWLNGLGVPTSWGGRTWSTGALQNIIENPVYLGQARSGKNVLENAHEPLIDVATWETAQEARGPRRGPYKKHHPLLKGLVRCANCQRVMSWARYRGKTGKRNPNSADYTCARVSSMGRCEHPASITAEGGRRVSGLDDFVIKKLFERLNEVRFEAADQTLIELEAEVAAARERLEQYLSDQELQQEVGRESFMTGAKSRRATLTDAQRQLDEARRSALREGWIDKPVWELEAEWPSLTREEQRAIMTSAVQAVFVRPARNSSSKSQDALADRVYIVWWDEPPIDVPRQGRRDWVPRPFVFPDSDPRDVGEAVLQDVEADTRDAVGQGA